MRDVRFGPKFGYLLHQDLGIIWGSPVRGKLKGEPFREQAAKHGRSGCRANRTVQPEASGQGEGKATV